MLLELADLDEALEFNDEDVIEILGAQAWDRGELDTDNPFPEYPHPRGWTEFDQWNEGWWKAANAFLRQDYPDRF